MRRTAVASTCEAEWRSSSSGVMDMVDVGCGGAYDCSGRTHTAATKGARTIRKPRNSAAKRSRFCVEGSSIETDPRCRSPPADSSGDLFIYFFAAPCCSNPSLPSSIVPAGGEFLAQGVGGCWAKSLACFAAQRLSARAVISAGASALGPEGIFSRDGRSRPDGKHRCDRSDASRPEGRPLRTRQRARRGRRGVQVVLQRIDAPGQSGDILVHPAAICPWL
jgi:hypothetical protein